MSILVKNARFVVTPTKVLENVDIYIEGNRIVELEREEADLVIDASEKIVIPGLINLSYDFGSFESEEKTYWLAVAKFAESLSSGATTVLATSHLPEELAKAAGSVGIRAFIGPELSEFSEEAVEEGLKRAEKIIKFLNFMGESRIGPVIGVKSLKYSSLELFEAVNAFVIKHDIMAKTSAGKSIEERRFIEREFGARPLEVLEAKKILNHRWIVTDCSWVEGRELASLKVSRANAVFSPFSEVLRGKIPDIGKFIKKGIKVGLGSLDTTGDMLIQLKLASTIKLVNRDFDPRKFLELATKKAAEILRLPAGEVRPGYLADLVLLSINENLLPIRSRAEVIDAVVFRARASNVSGVIVNGSLVSPEKLAEKARKRLIEIYQS